MAQTLNVSAATTVGVEETFPVGKSIGKARRLALPKKKRRGDAPPADNVSSNRPESHGRYFASSDPSANTPTIPAAM